MLKVEISILFLTALDIIKRINLMADPESVKRQSPVTTGDSPTVKCKNFGLRV